MLYNYNIWLCIGAPVGGTSKRRLRCRDRGASRRPPPPPKPGYFLCQAAFAGLSLPPGSPEFGAAQDKENWGYDQDRRHGLRPRQPRCRRDPRVRLGGARHQGAPAALRCGERLPGVRHPGDPRGPGQAARARHGARAGGARHAVRRRPRQERHPVGAQHLSGAAPGHADRLCARAGPGRQAAAGRGRSHPGGAGRGRRRRVAARHPADGGRARRFRPGRQLQHRQGHAHAVGRLRLRLGRDLLLRRDLPAGRARLGACRA